MIPADAPAMPVAVSSTVFYLGAAVTFVSLLVFARNDGKREGKIESMKSAMQTRLDDFGATLHRVNVKLDADEEHKREDAAWKADHDGRLGRAEADILRTRDQYHNEVAPKIQVALALKERIERLEVNHG